MNFEQEKKAALNHALVSNKLKVIIRMFDRDDTKNAINDLSFALQLFRKKIKDNNTTSYY
jgi:hypothetical protein